MSVEQAHRPGRVCSSRDIKSCATAFEFFVQPHSAGKRLKSRVNEPEWEISHGFRQVAPG